MAAPPRAGTDSKGRARYNLSGDKKAAQNGDEDAAARMRTKRRLDAVKVFRK